MSERDYSAPSQADKSKPNNAVTTKGGKPCGYVRNGEFIRKISPSHIIRHPAPALAYEPLAIQQAEALGAAALVAFDDLTTYRIGLQDFKRLATLRDLGRGPQLLLALSAWTMTRTGEPPEGPNTQPRLF